MLFVLMSLKKHPILEKISLVLIQLLADY